MNNLLPVILRSNINGTTIEVCHGEIPDIFRWLYFDPITEPELPDTKGTDEEFQEFLHHYRNAYQWYNPQWDKWASNYLLEKSKCN